MKRHISLLLLAVLVPACGCYWMAGPWEGPDKIEAKYEKIKDGMRDVQVYDALGDPSDTLYVTDEVGRIPKGSKEAWLLYKYDYPVDPILISIKIDFFGIVTEKHFDTPETLAEVAEKRTEEQKFSYPGAPLRRFQELQKLKRRGQY